ncbi:MAG: GntR family transcriptional regulator [Nannocystaceae bacterium]|nr:GntR family transcriptional regulator [Nannocystaceae bacterium]
MALQRIAKRTLSDEVFEQLSAEIVQGRMQPGVALPAERELCETLGVNRGALREALRRLAQAGLVSIAQGGATKVLDYRRNAGLDLLSQVLFRDGGTIDLEVARSVMEIRAALAPDIARLCARRADEATTRELGEVVAAMAARTDDLDALQQLSLDFWDLLVRGSDNIAYELAFNTLRVTYDTVRTALVHVMADELQDLASYRAIAEAVARKDDVSAKHVASALVEHGTHRMFELIAALGKSGTAAPDAGGTPS